MAQTTCELKLLQGSVHLCNIFHIEFITINISNVKQYKTKSRTNESLPFILEVGVFRDVIMFEDLPEIAKLSMEQNQSKALECR